MHETQFDLVYIFTLWHLLIFCDAHVITLNVMSNDMICTKVVILIKIRTFKSVIFLLMVTFVEMSLPYISLGKQITLWWRKKVTIYNIFEGCSIRMVMCGRHMRTWRSLFYL